MLTVVVFLLILTILVLIHELGHFLVAKKFGIKVEEFGFGLPPRAFGIKRGETIYSINWLPIGGFVKLYGEDEAGGGKVSTKNHEPLTNDLKRAFFSRPIWQRALVVVAGVAMNFILAVVILSYIFTQGVPTATGIVKINEIVADSPAAKVELAKGDVIAKINGENVKTIRELQSKIQPKVEEEVVLTIQRKDETKEVAVKTKKEVIEGRTVGIIGVGLSDSVIKHYSIWEAPVAGITEAIVISWATISGLALMLWGWLILGQAPQGVAGPVGVAQLTGQVVQVGPIAVFSFAGLLSLNLAIFNILPIPAKIFLYLD
ncbi:site-2 protease family protein [Candidatus Microgenomates bacterium]|nr:site-2 protease family protein [Candidatus Microgenomates bacterium]